MPIDRKPITEKKDSNVQPSTQKTSRLIFLIAMTLVFQMLGLPPVFTGPVINLMLILTSLVISPVAACILGVLTPVVAGLRGQLPGFMMPMIPFIMIANSVLILLFTAFRRFFARWLGNENILRSIPAWLGLVIGAFCKFLLLYYAARVILPLVLGIAMRDVVIQAMSLPQFLTALVGGALAFLIFRMLQTRFFLK
jgi:hypothetical protein